MREEFKYLVPNHKIDILRKFITPYVVRDDHIAIHRDTDYTVRSIYFDTLNLNEYHKKLAGVHTRHKIRIRGYNHHPFNDTVYLEIKRKQNMAIKKYRAPVKYSKINELFISSNLDDILFIRDDFPNAKTNATYFLYFIKRFHMVPVVLVIYEREAYIHKFDHNLRITFDKNLRCIDYPNFKSFFSDELSKNVFVNNFILEVKSNNVFPKWMERVIGQLNLKREALSKYTLSIDRHKNNINTFNKINLISRSNFNQIV